MKVAKLVKFAQFVKDENGRTKEIIPGEIRIDEEPIPEISDSEVLLKILYFGICGSDQQIYHGQHMSVTEDKLPRVMGHELSARIVKVGKNVTDFQVGEKVVVEPQVYCGECYPCRIGRFNVCEHLEVMGVHRDGFNCEYAAIDPKYLHHVPQDIPADLLAIVEPLAVGVGCIKRSHYKGSNICIVSGGTIGNLAAQAAKGLGAGKVLVTDLLQHKLDYALECGVDYAMNTGEMTLKEAIYKCFGDRGADVIVDCVATPPVFNTILDATRPASEIVVTGNYKVPAEIFIPRLQRREISLIGHMMYVREDYADAIRLLSEGKINTSKLISQRWDFKDYQKAMEFGDAHPSEVMKMVVKVAEDE